MKVIVDAFGGDHAPLEVILGAEMAVREKDISIILTGNEQIILETARKNGIKLDNIEICDTVSIVSMEDESDTVLKDKKDSSMSVGMQLLKDGTGDAFVSCGNTGALLMGATFINKRIKGIKRAALAPILPTDNGKGAMLIDGGANVECKADFLVQFGIMGSIYAKHIMGIENPRVGLINNGSEQSKGTPLQKMAYDLLQHAPINFIGNIEGRDLLSGKCDVIVTDGFTGNIILKVVEGMGSSFSRTLKDVFYKNALTKLGGLLVKDGIDSFKKKMDYREQGGSPLMGISKPVIKAHGSSDARALKNAVCQAVKVVESGIIRKIETSLPVAEEIK